MSEPTEVHLAYQSALLNAGVPANFASECASVLVKDDPTQPDLGRSQQDQLLINSSMEWMKTKGFFDRENLSS